MFKRPNFTLQIWKSPCSSSLYPSQSSSWDHTSSTKPDSKSCCISLSVGRKPANQLLKTQQTCSPYSSPVEAITKNQQIFPLLTPARSSAEPMQLGDGELDSIHLWATSLDCLLPKSQLVPAVQCHAGQHCDTAIPSPQGLAEWGHEGLGWKQPVRHSHFLHRHLLTGLLAMPPL